MLGFVSTMGIGERDRVHSSGTETARPRPGNSGRVRAERGMCRVAVFGPPDRLANEP